MFSRICLAVVVIFALFVGTFAENTEFNAIHLAEKLLLNEGVESFPKIEALLAEFEESAACRFFNASIPPLAISNKSDYEVYANRLSKRLDLLLEKPEITLDMNWILGYHTQTFFWSYFPFSMAENMAKWSKAFMHTFKHSFQFHEAKEVQKVHYNSKVRFGVVFGSFYSQTVMRLLSNMFVYLTQSPLIELHIFDFSISDANMNDDDIRIRKNLMELLCEDCYHDARDMELTAMKDVHGYIVEKGMQILLFPDTSMQKGPQIIALFRNAPVQLNTLNNGFTTGSPFMDYTVSMHVNEPENGQDFYTEKLELLNGAYTSRAMVADTDVLEPPVELVEAMMEKRCNGQLCSRVYTCVQSKQKITPWFYEMMNMVMEKDSKCLIVFRSDVVNSGLLMNAFMKEVKEEFHERVIFLSRSLTVQEFTGLMGFSEASLDTYPFGGGLTSYESLLAGTPVVTIDAPSRSGRITAGFYRTLGLIDECCVVKTIEEYADLVVRLGNDSTFRRNISQKIRRNFPLLAKNDLFPLEWSRKILELSTPTRPNLEIDGKEVGVEFGGDDYLGSYVGEAAHSVEGGGLLNVGITLGDALATEEQLELLRINEIKLRVCSDNVCQTQPLDKVVTSINLKGLEKFRWFHISAILFQDSDEDTLLRAHASRMIFTLPAGEYEMNDDEKLVYEGAILVQTLRNQTYPAVGPLP